METSTGNFTQLLESGALGLKREGVFTTEFSGGDLDSLIRSMLQQSEAEMKKQGIAAQINRLNVNIENGKGGVATDITASKKVGFMNPKVGISATFGLENVNGSDGQPTGRLRTTQLNVAPETLFMVIKPRDFLAPYVEGEKINETFRGVMDAEMGQRGAKVTNLSLVFTQENKLRVTAKGSAK